MRRQMEGLPRSDEPQHVRLAPNSTVESKVLFLGPCSIRIAEPLSGDVIFGLIDATGIKHREATFVIVATDTDKVAVRSDVLLPKESRYHVMCKSIELRDRTGLTFTEWDLSVSNKCLHAVRKVEGQHHESYTEVADQLIEPLQRRLAKLRQLSVGYLLGKSVIDFADPKTVKSFLPFVRDVMVGRAEIQLINTREEQVRLRAQLNECNARRAEHNDCNPRALAEIDKRAIEMALDLSEQRRSILLQQRKELLKSDEFPAMKAALEHKVRSLPLDPRTLFEIYNRRARLRAEALQTWFRGLRLLEDLKRLGKCPVTVKDSLVPAQRALSIPQPVNCELFREQVAARTELEPPQLKKHQQVRPQRMRVG